MIEKISLYILPLMILFILSLALIKKVPVYEEFIEGAKDGFKVSISIIPYLVAIIVAVSMFRASGILDWLKDFANNIIPPDIIPLMITRPLSGSAALGIFSDIAKEYGIRVYTIGIGKMGYAPYPYQTPFGKQYQNVEVKIDEQLLKQIASTTGGKYFRSTKKSSLEEIFKEIDSMEKSKIDVYFYKQTKDIGQNLILLVIAILIVEMLLRKTYLKTNP